MSHVFDTYARYYDLLYRDKDYLAESKYIVSHIQKHLPQATQILELGCGTGAHAEHLARMGYTVHGVDLSESMLRRAEERRVALPSDVAARMSFSLGDARTVRTGKLYDVVISLFHVMSYQVLNTDLVAAFETAATHLSKNGLFLFDYWYGPAVFAQKPEVRIKRLEDNDIKVIRLAEPNMHVNANTVDVNYTVLIERKATSDVEKIEETHHMRYLFLPELECYGEKQFNETFSYAWMTYEPLDADTWAGFQVMVRA